MFQSSRSTPVRKTLAPATGLLYAGFLYTGAMVVLLGVLLPRIAALYHLSDRQGGELLMVQYASCACGALLVRRNLDRTLALGYALLPVSAVAMAVLPPPLAAAAIGLFGLSLGMAMTSTSMLVGRIFPLRRGAALSFLNFCWSIGAAVCPLVMARVPADVPLRAVCLTAAAVALPFVAIPRLGNFQTPEEARLAEAEGRAGTPGIVVYFAVLAFLYVGIEASVGNWMSTYAARVAAWNYAWSSVAASCFWTALLVGRGLTPAVLQGMGELRLFLLSAAAALGGVGLLVAANGAGVLVAGAVLAGLGLAPLFPLTLSLFMARAGETRHAGWVFAVAGFGGAALPWMTGVVSSGAGSLRAGLLVPALAAAALLAMAIRLGIASCAGTPGPPAEV